ncbi:MAG: aconitate hydratase, partial [Candidatus Omnitrophica bacterium]|nr:aconitate hydratase [Candidatus Omnitrophota bacterium]
MAPQDPFGARTVLPTPRGPVHIYRLQALAGAVGASLDHLPFSLRVLLENLLRQVDGFRVTADDVARLAGWQAQTPAGVELPFMPARVVLQDFTGVPCLVDLAALRAALARAGGDPARINPLVPCDLVIDHSVQVDAYG